MNHLTLLCDLDGTLVDSAPAILHSLACALGSLGLSTRAPLERSLIGPPLDILISKVLAAGDQARRTDVAKRFREHYDEVGCLRTAPFPELDRVARALRDQGNNVFVVTNKRAIPTHKILEHLGIAGTISAIYCADSVEGAQSKTDVARALLRDYALDAGRCVFVGDSEDDSKAARELGMHFILASYGYGDEGLQSCAVRVLHQLRDLPVLVAELERYVATYPDQLA